MGMKAKAGDHQGIFFLLVLLALGMTGANFLQLSKQLHNLLLFSIATTMAVLVAIQYMGLKREGTLIYLLLGIPALLFVIVVVFLIPDLVVRANLISPVH